MNRKNLYENAVIIAPRESWDFFYHYRKEYPDADFSLMTQEMVEDLFSYQYDERAVLYLYEQGESYEKSEDILRSIKNLDGHGYKEPKLKMLEAKRDELLQKGLIYKSEYPERTFLGKTVVYHGYADTTRVRKVFDKLKGGVMIAAIPDNEEEPCTGLEYHEFLGIYEELHYVYNRIGELIKNGTNINDIYLFGVDSSYAYLLPRMSKAYGFTVNCNVERKLIVTPMAKAFLESISSSSFEEAIASIKKFEDDSSYELLVKKMRAYTSDALDKEKQLALYKAVLEATEVEFKEFDDVVGILTEPYAPEGSHIFIVNFALGVVPKVFVDEDFLRDEEKKILHEMTSKDKTFEYKAALVKFLTSGHIESVSYHQVDLDGIKLKSPILDEQLPFSIPSKILLNDDNSCPKEYSGKFLDLEVAHLLDVNHDFLKFSPRINPILEVRGGSSWRSYDPQFIMFEQVDADRPVKLNCTNVGSYFECPFKYYMGYVLELKDSEYAYHARSGIILHSVLDDLHKKKDFDWEASFEKAVADEIEKHGPFSSKEQVLLTHLKENAKWVVEATKEQESHMANPTFSTENYFSVSGIAENTTLVGKIDKAIVTEANGQKYLTLVDYKSGTSTNFEPKKLRYGLSLQLPTYALAMESDPEYKDIPIAGLFISHIGLSKLENSSKKSWRDTLYSKFILDGIYVDDEEAMLSLESANQEGNQEPVQTYKHSEKNICSKETLIEYIEIAREKYKEADKGIREGIFPVTPLMNDPEAYKGACDFCNYRDICYLREVNNRYCVEEEDEEKDGSDS